MRYKIVLNESLSKCNPSYNEEYMSWKLSGKNEPQSVPLYFLVVSLCQLLYWVLSLSLSLGRLPRFMPTFKQSATVVLNLKVRRRVSTLRRWLHLVLCCDNTAICARYSLHGLVQSCTGCNHPPEKKPCCPALTIDNLRQPESDRNRVHEMHSNDFVGPFCNAC
jgi:hypothetical protein